MYSLNMPVSKIRTTVRREFEKHKYVNQLGAIDVLLMQSNMEFQVSSTTEANASVGTKLTCHVQETLNYWKQLTHVMKYFRAEEDETARLPRNFMSGFLEVCVNSLRILSIRADSRMTDTIQGRN